MRIRVRNFPLQFFCSVLVDIGSRVRWKIAHIIYFFPTMLFGMALFCLLSHSNLWQIVIELSAVHVFANLSRRTYK